MNFAQTNQFAPKQSLKVFLDGRIVPVAEAKISVFDHGLLYGDGVFEGIRSYGGRVFRLEQHLKRLEDSARAIRLEIPMSREELTTAVYDTLKANNVQDGYIRLVVTRGVGYLGLSPQRTSCPSVFIIADQIELYPREMYERGMAIISSSVVRNHPNAVSPRIKSLNYLNNILAKIEALDAGVHEAVMYNHLGFVAECTGDNIFLVRKGTVLTPTLAGGNLEGVTREAVIELIRRRNIPLSETDLTRHDMYVADECFLTGSAAEIVPVTQIDGRPIGTGKPGPITGQLMADFHELVRQEK
ncbi:MAG TPA: branched-chain-amino-acid transaminase [Phycisphaerae bacterium]|jgi:branched-chain amino acid aminotransferase|nr:branched-chain-amino-acid transaminase [Phycisphaerae bacterium]HOB75353.1 branched-chain-amino-acid transaminase [Phycisphaerae bacterium]HOJ55515.1 branched-chain-amino-acid transaminase [Phycisphaerae bacterium]HOL26025.1 branched-chain-amino-acid transaminase [Phycisphaerae bacterium]HPP22545.1 branched-chain-amino-acid transaminase [Phycisphaerae bacterium]